MRRLFAVIGIAAMSLHVGTAWAHEELSPETVRTGKPAYLVLSASNEKQVDVNRLVITAPTGGEFGHATRDPAGWTAAATHTRITWTGGAIRPGRFEQFGFDIGGFNQPGTILYQVSLGYADGSSSNVEMPVTAVADIAQPSPTTTAAPAGPTSSPSPPPPGEAPATTAVAAADDGDGTGLATALSVIALVVALASAVLALRRRPAAAPGGAAPAPAQDW